MPGEGDGGFGHCFLAALEPRAGGTSRSSISFKAGTSVIIRKAYTYESSRRDAEGGDIKVRATIHIICLRRTEAT